jgi:hypothetical protein
MYHTKAKSALVLSELPHLPKKRSSVLFKGFASPSSAEDIGNGFKRRPMLWI